jgi:hypothetical protein
MRDRGKTSRGRFVASGRCQLLGGVMVMLAP